MIACNCREASALETESAVCTTAQLEDEIKRDVPMQFHGKLLAIAAAQDNQEAS